MILLIPKFDPAENERWNCIYKNTLIKRLLLSYFARRNFSSFQNRQKYMTVIKTYVLQEVE